jgi:hypothetical protein
MLMPTAAWGQQFDEDTNARLPAPSPLEYSEQVDLADVDGDGDLDIMFANGSGFASPSQQQRNRLYINDGTGVFTDESLDRTPIALVGFTRDVEFGDVDDDGDLDLLIVNTFNTQSWLLINDGTGNFTHDAGALPISNFSGSDADFGDVDDDGDLDIIFTNTGTSAFGTSLDRLYINDGTGTFTNESAARLPGVAVAESIDCDFADIDGDLDLDLVMGHRNGRSQLWRNDGDGNFTDITLANLPNDGSGTYSVDPGDIDGDGDLDILVVRGSSELAFQNDGTGDFVNVAGTAIPNNPFQDDNDGDFFDFDNDGDLDYVIARLGSGGERIYRNDNGVMNLTSGMITVISDSTLDIEPGDVNNDGRLDIVTAQGESGNFRNRIYIGSGPIDTVPPNFANIAELADTPNTSNPHIVRASVRDGISNDNNFPDRGATLSFRVGNGPTQTNSAKWVGGDVYRGEIPPLAAGSVITYSMSVTDWAHNTGVSDEHTFTITGGVLGDEDGDSDVDLNDVDAYFECAGGAPDGGNCAAFDFDGDGDTDFSDYGGLQIAYTG